MVETLPARSRRAWHPLWAPLASVVVAAVLIGWLAADGVWSGAGTVGSRDLVLLCAAGVVRPVQEVATAFEREVGVRVQIEPGPSGKLLAQLRVAKGRAQLFLAADASYVDRALALGLVTEAFPVARIHPVIAVAAGNPKGVRGIDDLLRDDVRVALANPELASIGRTVKERLGRIGAWDRLESRSRAGGAALSFAGTVTEVAQAVRIGAADAGIVWDSLPRQFGLASVEVDVFAAPELVTVGVVAPAPDDGAPSRLAESLAFARYLTARDRGQLAFARAGFAPVPGAVDWDGRGTMSPRAPAP